MATKIAAELADPQATMLVEAVAAARYMVNASEDKANVVLPLPIWEKLLEWVEDVEDRALVQAWLPTLKQGPKASGALKWDDIASEWEDGKPIKAITG